MFLADACDCSLEANQSIKYRLAENITEYHNILRLFLQRFFITKFCSFSKNIPIHECKTSQTKKNNHKIVMFFCITIQ